MPLYIAAWGFPWFDMALQSRPGGLATTTPAFHGPHFAFQRIVFLGAHPVFGLFSGFWGPALCDAFSFGFRPWPGGSPRQWTVHQ